MTIEAWWVWMILAVFFVIGEVFTAGFFLFGFGIGAAAAGILALLGAGPVWQGGIFVVVSGAFLAVSRRLAERFTRKQPPGIGADRFIGQVGVALEDIDNVQSTGRVRLGKEEWRAKSVTGQVILAGTEVKVTKLDGTHLVVKTTAKEEK
ncbi:MAG: NfeD family protein [Terriglobia bacterium]